MKKILLVMLLFSLIFMGCTDAALVSSNMSKSADQFEILRRVVFYNGITDTYILQVEGFCSINVDGNDNQLEIIVKTGPREYKKHFLGLSDNVTYFAEQIDAANVSTNHYRVIFKPAAILLNIDVE
jgi:hypothetical protein